jgi:hypothetical protein
VISIASLADDIIAWNKFILGIIVSYRDVVNFLWGGLFSLFDLRLPQYVHDYLTLSSLCATSVAWALYSSSKKLGFGALSSFWQFLKNNVGSTSLATSHLANFAAGAILELQRTPGALTDEVRTRIQAFAVPHRSARLLLEGLLAMVVFLAFFFVAAFLIPPLMYALDVRNCKATVAFMARRRMEIESSSVTPSIKLVLLTEFDPRYQTARDEIHIIKLYHRELWMSLLWYFLTVFIAFALIILINYVGRRLA